MPFSSLSDPVDLARAGAALDTARDKIRATLPDARRDRERTRLAQIVASLATIANDEDDLARRAIGRFRETL
ncbi:MULTISPECIES: hypothetical protein [unclassified Bosea (in: a-proteobacteria)]|nr:MULTISPECIES: hypothetical protein [unclassified Bosea (in: a-proteobacteria)]